jgi:formylglycine-generating enzyme required for sulfatase activity
MIYIDEGYFFVGDFFEGSDTDATPVHEVKVDPFYIGKYEVTFEQYDAFAKENNMPLPDDEGLGRGKRAVINVTWNEAQQFCNHLGMRLPTENEWEYAARSAGKKHLYSGTSNPDSLHFFTLDPESNLNFSVQVGLNKPNHLGIYDMTGNVFEWIGDFYQFYSDPNNMHDNENDGVRIIRGGSFRFLASNFRRIGTLKDVREDDLGFRCVKEVK